MHDNCPFCGDLPSETDDDLPATLLREYSNWTLVQAFNQYYLGRCIAVLDRHIVDLPDLDGEERDELFETVLPQLRAALDELFQPDLINYASLGNEVEHLHLHILPRYREPREVAGKRFNDENWGRHYKPYPRDFEISDHVFQTIRSRLQDALP
ncbi:MAG: HIT family protein [Candidatus Nanohaloarchaea archaeon]|nr:HIT family protein [Candidatus Nanohaloarchaea archaeon]